MSLMTKACYLLESFEDGNFTLVEKQGDSNKSFSYHLYLKQTLEQAIAENQVEKYHFTLLRNLYEKTASFLGYPKWSELLPDDKQTYLNRIIQFTPAIAPYLTKLSPNQHRRRNKRLSFCWIICRITMATGSSKNNMVDYTKPIAESNRFIVLDKYTREWQVKESYQSEDDLEQELIEDLQNQGYEYLPGLNNLEAMLANVREQLQTLNNVQFAEDEWLRFVETYLDKSSDTIIDKTRKVHDDYIHDFVFDDGTYSEHLSVWQEKYCP